VAAPTIPPPTITTSALPGQLAGAMSGPVQLLETVFLSNAAAISLHVLE
jgi:hypothetical protein